VSERHYLSTKLNTSVPESSAPPTDGFDGESDAGRCERFSATSKHVKAGAISIVNVLGCYYSKIRAAEIGGLDVQPNVYNVTALLLFWNISN